MKLTRMPRLANKGETKNFLRTALTWHGSVSPHIMPRVFFSMVYSALVIVAAEQFPHVIVPITPFEYSGAVLGLLLVLRVNAGLDRWWEARKIWGSIVNQSRNLALIGYEYSQAERSQKQEYLHWVAAWPHVMRESLRKETQLNEPTRLLGAEATEKIRRAVHMPTYVGSKIAKLLIALRGQGLDNFAFQRAERERALLIDAIGACERIRSTPIPLVLAIKMRRFILMFILLLPLALVDRVDWFTPLVVALAAYPLFALDEIGAELQNPFSPRNLSHLPLDSVCSTIEKSVLSIDSFDE